MHACMQAGCVGLVLVVIGLELRTISLAFASPSSFFPLALESSFEAMAEGGLAGCLSREFWIDDAGLRAGDGGIVIKRMGEIDLIVFRRLILSLCFFVAWECLQAAGECVVDKR